MEEHEEIVGNAWEGTTRTQRQSNQKQNKTKPKSYSVALRSSCPRPTHNPLGSKAPLIRFSGSATHSSCGLSRRLGHAAAGLGSHSETPGISKMLPSPLQLGCTFTARLFWALFSASDTAVRCQAFILLHDPFIPESSTSTEAARSPMASPDLPWC